MVQVNDSGLSVETLDDGRARVFFELGQLVFPEFKPPYVTVKADSYYDLIAAARAVCDNVSVDNLKELQRVLGEV